MNQREILETLEVLKSVRNDHVKECHAEIRELTAKKIVKYLELL